MESQYLDRPAAATLHTGRNVTSPPRGYDPEAKELPANITRLVESIYGRLSNLNNLADDMLARLVGPRPIAGAEGKGKELSLLERLEACDSMAHSLTCTANDISTRIG